MNKELEQTKSKLEKELEEQIKSNLIIERDAQSFEAETDKKLATLKQERDESSLYHYQTLL